MAYLSRSSLDSRWRELSGQFQAHCRSVGAACHLCVLRGDHDGAAINYWAKPGAPDSFATDHINTWDAHPELRYDWHNLAPSHSRCNKQRGNMTLERYLEKYGGADSWVQPDW